MGMIKDREKITIDKALHHSMDCVRCFSAYNRLGCPGVYMIFQVVADESYAAKDGNCTVAIGGWLTTNERMKSFCKSWAAVLKKHKVPHFHFCEFADKNHKSFETTVYDDMSEEDRELFLYELALVACELGPPVGGCDMVKMENGIKEKAISRSYMA